MSFFLGIESSSAQVSVHAGSASETLFTKSFETPRRKTGPLFSTASAALHSLREVSEPFVVLAGAGPGSYNGIRAAFSLAQGIALATASEFAGVPSILGLPAGRQLVVGDARAGQCFWAVVEKHRFVHFPSLAEIELLAKLPDLHPDAEPIRVGALPVAENQYQLRYPDAANLGLVPREEWLHAPLYLKEAHITKPKSKSGS